MPVRRRVYGSHGAPTDAPAGYSWNAVEGTLGSQYQLPQYELTPIPGYQAPGTQTTTGTGNTGAAGGVPQLPDYSEIGSLIAQINANNQAAQRSANLGRIPGAGALEMQSSENIADLLDPPDVLSEIDVGGAARAVGSGTSGSPFAGVTGIQLSENEKIRRRALGQQQLSMAYGRNPSAPIADPQGLLTYLGSQRFQAGESAASRALQLELARREQQTALAIAAMRGSGRAGTDGGGYYGPRVPVDYGRAPSAAPSFRAGIPDTVSASGWDVPGISPGTGMAYSVPDYAVPDNWADLTIDERAEYAGALGANPYLGLPDYMNPYE